VPPRSECREHWWNGPARRGSLGRSGCARRGWVFSQSWSSPSLAWLIHFTARHTCFEQRSPDWRGRIRNPRTGRIGGLDSSSGVGQGTAIHLRYRALATDALAIPIVDRSATRQGPMGSAGPSGAVCPQSSRVALREPMDIGRSKWNPWQNSLPRSAMTRCWALVSTPFTDNGQVEQVRHFDGLRHNRMARSVSFEVGNEAPVNFDHVHRKLLEVAERRVSRAKIIES
jgi:hypothetical protein